MRCDALALERLQGNPRDCPDGQQDEQERRDDDCLAIARGPLLQESCTVHPRCHVPTRAAVLDLACNRRERGLDVRAEQPDSADDGDRNHGQDDRVLGHRLPVLAVREPDIEMRD